MPIMYNTGEWFKVRPDYYRWVILIHPFYTNQLKDTPINPIHRKVELTTPDWPLDLDLEYMWVEVAPYGGPLAVTRDPTKLVPVKGNARPMIRIFDTTGREMGHILVSLSKVRNIISNIEITVVEPWQTYCHGLVRHGGAYLHPGERHRLCLRHVWSGKGVLQHRR